MAGTSAGAAQAVPEKAKPTESLRFMPPDSEVTKKLAPDLLQPRPCKREIV